MRHAARFAFILLFASNAQAGPPTTAPTTSVAVALPDATLDRGDALRLLLRDTLERAYADDECWPATIDLPPGVAYARPTTPATRPSARLPDPRQTTIALEESFAAHPDGVWIGYADGHVEFARTPVDLAACREGAAIAAAATEYDEADLGPVDPAGAITLRVVDPDGRTAAAGAHVGIDAFFGDRARDRFGHGPVFQTAEGYEVVEADAAGRVRIAATQPFRADAQFGTVRAAPMIAFDESRDLIAWTMLDRDRFAPDAPRVTLTLAPACHVRGVATNLGIRGVAGRSDRHVRALAFVPGQLRQYTILSSNEGEAFDVPLPPGDWCMAVYSTAGDFVWRYLRIRPGERERVLYLDLPTRRVDALVGHPAPELRSIKAWKNAPPPLTLAALRGKLVLLDFWGSWCGPCVQSMPTLMTLYDEFHARGLEVVAIHDDSVASIAEMEGKLTKTRAELWGGRELPFPVALDGGGDVRIAYTSSVGRGATTAAYGITDFPTTIVVGRDGTVIGKLDVHADDAREQLAALLDAPTTRRSD